MERYRQLVCVVEQDRGASLSPEDVSTKRDGKLDFEGLDDLRLGPDTGSVAASERPVQARSGLECFRFSWANRALAGFLQCHHQIEMEMQGSKSQSRHSVPA